MNDARYHLIRLADVPAVPCSCGETRRAFTDRPDSPASIHDVTIAEDVPAHYHRAHAEIYYVLSGEGEIELDGQRHPIATGDAVQIQPGCRHRAIGRMRILNVSIPPYDPADEWFD